MKGKLKAFTLLELMIGLIISSLVISLGYMGYFVVYKQYITYVENSRTINKAMQLKVIIDNDIKKASFVHFSEPATLMMKDENEEEQVSYNFVNGAVVRSQQESIDTFAVATTNHLAVPLAEHQNELLPLITDFSFDANVLEEKEHYVFIKQYAADVIINHSSE